uniref:hypothetical protein n=1 Tax=Escherichia coli TaxID=562 RepID=UPI001953542F
GVPRRILFLRWLIRCHQVAIGIALKLINRVYTLSWRGAEKIAAFDAGCAPRRVFTTGKTLT